MAAEPSLADVLARLDTFAVETRTRIEALAAEGRARDTAHVERSVRLEEKVESRVGALSSGLAVLNEELRTLKDALPAIEKTATEAGDMARKSFTSYHGLESSILSRLDQQDRDRDVYRVEREKREAEAKRAAAEEKERKDLALAEERRQESLAVRRMALRTERQKIWAPVWQATIIAAITGVVGYATVRAGHQDTDAKLTAISKRVESIQVPAPEPVKVVK